jgi:hypothetical protein
MRIRYITALLAIVAMTPTAQAAAVATSVNSYGNEETFPATVATETNIRGAVVTDYSTATAWYQDNTGARVNVGSVAGAATGMSDYGLMRIGASAGITDLPSLVPPGAPSFFGYTAAQATSSFSDEWHIKGGTPGDFVNGVISGVVEYNASVTGGAKLQNADPQAQISFGFSVSSLVQPGAIVFSTGDFAVGDGQLAWSVEFTARSGETVPIAGLFQVLFEPSFCGLGPGDTNCVYAFNAMQSAEVRLVTLDTGYSLEAASGTLRAGTGGFVYDAVAQVPEPATYGLMLLGVAALAAHVRRRRTPLAS